VSFINCVLYAQEFVNLSLIFELCENWKCQLWAETHTINEQKQEGHMVSPSRDHSMWFYMC
jgi:hypothetical protein